MKRFLSLTALALLLVVAIIGCQQAPKELKIAILSPMSGKVPTFGLSTKEGALLAIDEWNAKGGVLGMKITAIVEDSQCTPDPAVNAANKVVNQDKVHYIVGEVCSKASIPISEIANAAKVIQISPTSTNTAVTVDKSGATKAYIFRACFIDPFQGTVGARFAVESLKAKTAAVMYDVGNDYSKGLADYFKAAFEKGGGKVTAFESYSKDDVDFSALLTKVKQSSPVVLFLPDYYNKVGLIAKQARQLGVTATFLGGDGWDSPEMAKIAGDAINGGYFTNHYSPDDPRPEVQEWVKKYQAKYGQKPDALATLGYDAGLLLIQALKNALNAKPDEIKAALGAIKDFPCVSGKITFDEWGNPIKSAAVLEYTKDGQKYVTTINP
jgi:branched-chain amino acid transport system substrate-binding protein